MISLSIISTEIILCYLLYKRIKAVQLNNHKEIRKSMRSFTKKKRK